MPPTTATFPDIVRTFKTALHEILSAYFNGAVHEVADTNITFPQALLVYDTRPLDTPTGLTIAILGETTIDQREEKCLVGGKPGIEVRADVLRTVVIASPNDASNELHNRSTVDFAWGCLHALVTQHSLFSARNIYVPLLSLLPSDVTPASNIVEATGQFTCQVRASFLRHN